MIQPPANAVTTETDLGTYWFDESGILISISKPPKRTVANCEANFAAIRQFSGGKKVPLMVYICKSPVPDKETRKVVAEGLPGVYTAMAMISKSGLGTVIMNFLFKLNPPSIPMKTFANETDARKWLRQYL